MSFVMDSPICRFHICKDVDPVDICTNVNEDKRRCSLMRLSKKANMRRRQKQTHCTHKSQNYLSWDIIFKFNYFSFFLKLLLASEDGDLSAHSIFDFHIIIFEDPHVFH
jgi:hypothetical protein